MNIKPLPSRSMPLRPLPSRSLPSRPSLPLLLICLLALLTLAPAAHATFAPSAAAASAAAGPTPDAAALPDALRGTPLEGYTLTCQAFAPQYGPPGNGSAYAIATGNGTNVLCAFEQTDGGWQLRVTNAHALPAGSTQLSITIDESNPLVIIDTASQTGRMQLRFVIDGSERTPYGWPLFSVDNVMLNANGTTRSITRIAPSEETGKWEVSENGEHKSYEDRAHTRMDDFDLRLFPLTRAAADVMWHGMDRTVFIERDDRAIAEGLPKLTGHEVTLPGDRTLPVYSGPGDHYLRGANGKAAVGTNAPVTVYAVEFDWVLIHYGVSHGERFGYIPRGHLPADLSIDHDFMRETMSVGLTTREVAVLDNLSTPDAPLCTLPYQTPLEVYATLGDRLYVGGTAPSGDAFWGFIPLDAFHHTNNF